MNSKKISSPSRLNSLGKSGIMVTELGFGGIPIMRLNGDEAKLVIKHCFELGIRFFDTAHMYGDSEEKLGKALEPFRDQVIIATKVWAKDRKGCSRPAGDEFGSAQDKPHRSDPMPQYLQTGRSRKGHGSRWSLRGSRRS